MSIRDFFANLLVVCGPAVLGLVALGVGKLTAAMRQYVRQRTLALRLELLANQAGIAVANAYQTMVRDLKDPSKPGHWNEVAARAVRDAVVSDVKAAVPKLGAEIASEGVADVDAVLARMIEKAVLELKARVPATVEAEAAAVAAPASASVNATANAPANAPANVTTNVTTNGSANAGDEVKS